MYRIGSEWETGMVSLEKMTVSDAKKTQHDSAADEGRVEQHCFMDLRDIRILHTSVFFCKRCLVTHRNSSAEFSHSEIGNPISIS